MRGLTVYSGWTKEVYDCSDPEIFVILGHGSFRRVHWICLLELYDVKFLWRKTYCEGAKRFQHSNLAG